MVVQPTNLALERRQRNIQAQNQSSQQTQITNETEAQAALQQLQLAQQQLMTRRAGFTSRQNRNITLENLRNIDLQKQNIQDFISQFKQAQQQGPVITPEVYNQAYKVAINTFNKGYTGEWLYTYGSEAARKPYTEMGITYTILKDLQKQQKGGFIIPGDSKILHQIKFPNPELNPKLIVQPGQEVPNIYPNQISAYYDPITGQPILQSMDPSIAQSKGYVPIQVIGQYDSGGGIISNSNLLTQRQQEIQKILEQNPKLSPIFGGGKIDTSQLRSQININILGGKPSTPRTLTPEEIYYMNLPKTPQDIAMRQTPFDMKLPTTKEELYGGKLKPIYNPLDFQIQPLYSRLNRAKQNEITALTDSKMPLTEYEKILWNRDPKAFSQQYGYELVKKGGEVYRVESGGVVPITPEDVTQVVSGPMSLSKLGITKGLTFLGSKAITYLPNLAYEKTYQPTTFGGQFLKATLASLAISRSPTVAAAYGYDLAKGLMFSPKETSKAIYQQATQRPGELAGFLVGGALAQKGMDILEYQFRGVPVEKLTIPNYGEVIVQKIPKFRDVVWVKGAFDNSEKIDIMEQINRLRGEKERVFVQVSPQGVPTRVFSNTKNLGFEIAQISQPMRGLYDAPPFKFLEKYQNVLNSNAGALSFYAREGARERILPNPLEAAKSLLEPGNFTLQRAFQQISRSRKPIETPKWMETLSKAMKEGKDIPPSVKGIVDKYYKKFLEEPLEFNGRTYVGLAKEKLVNEVSLRSRGSGIKLKVYAAVIQFQKEMKVDLVGGAELISGVNPYGPESQIVRGIGGRRFLKSIEDLRRGIKPSIGRKIVELLTGTKRGQLVSRIDGQMIEIQPVRQFSKKLGVKEKVISKASEVTKPIREGFSEELLGRTKEKLSTERIKELSAKQKELIRRQANHEVDLLEINFGKLNELQRERAVSIRYEKLLKEYTKSLSEKSRLEQPKNQQLIPELRRREGGSTKAPRPIKITSREELRRPELRQNLLRYIRREPPTRRRPELIRRDLRIPERRREPPREQRMVGRRPELIRRGLREIRRTEKTRDRRREERVPPRRPTSPQSTTKIILGPKQLMKKVGVKPSKKPTRFGVLPTVFQQIANVRRVKSLRKITGFEAIRI